MVSLIVYAMFPQRGPLKHQCEVSSDFGFLVCIVFSEHWFWISTLSMAISVAYFPNAIDPVIRAK